MTNIELLQRIFSSVWSISQKEAAGYLPLIMQIANRGSELSFGDIKERRIDLQAKTSTLFVTEMRQNENAFIVQSSRSFQEIQNDSFAVMRINGVIQKDSDVCNKGLDAYAEELSLAGSNPLIKGVLLEVHSGGGTAFGGDSFAKLVGDFEKTYNKPVAALISHTAASAAYEIIAKTPMIFVDGETAQAGSIGTMTTLFNYEEMMQAEGVKQIIVRASDSFNKNDEYYQALNGNTKPLQENILDPLNRAFQNVVKQGRRGKLNLSKMSEDSNGNKAPEVLTGKVYFGKDIISMGLADEMGSRAEALKYLSKREKQMKTISETSKTKKSMFDILNKTEEELNESLSQLNEKIAQETEASQVEALQAEKTAIEKVVELKSLSAKVEELSIKNQGLSQELEISLQTKENIESISQELESTKLSLSESQTANEQNLSKISESENQISQLEEKLLKIEAEKIEVQSKAGAFEEFINAQYGSDKAQQIQIGKTSTEQPEPTEKIAPKTVVEKKYGVVRESKNIVEQMMKG
jgi:ClpP class serine protease